MNCSLCLTGNYHWSVSKEMVCYICWKRWVS